MAHPETNTVTRLDYCQYLFSSQINYPLTNFAEHVETLSHDMVNRYLQDEKLTPAVVWEHTKGCISSLLNVIEQHSIEYCRWSDGFFMRLTTKQAEGMDFPDTLLHLNLSFVDRERHHALAV